MSAIESNLRTLGRKISLACPLRVMAVAGLLLAVLSPLPAMAQLSETESLINRLIRLEREVQTLNLQVYRGEPAPAAERGRAAPMPDGYAAQFEVRLAQIERQMRDLTGRLEQSQFRVRQLTERLDRALTDIEYRLTVLEGGEPPEPGVIPYATSDSAPLPAAESPTQLAAGGAAGAAGTAGAAGAAGSDLTVAPAPGALTELELTAEPALEAAPAAETAQVAAVSPTAVELPVGDAATQYDYAYGLLAQGDYDRAEQALVMFADANPDHPLTSNARYWLGETFYVRGRYDDAAIAFAQGYQSFPDGAKAVDSLLKLGMALAAAGNRDDACLTLNQLDVEFPNAPTGIKRRATQERSRLQCI